MKILSKPCQVCQQIFNKPVSCSLKTWSSRKKFCSVTCRRIYVAQINMGGNRGGFKKGDPGYWLGKKRPNISGVHHHLFGKKMPEEWRRKLGIKKKGRQISPLTQFKKGSLPWNKGKTVPKNQGANNSNWRGGVTPANEKIRKSVEYKNWRTAVFTRDNYTCQKCGQYGGNLEADHDLPFSLFPDLRFEVLNGQTLCQPCHRETPTYGDLRAIKRLHMMA